MTYCTQQDLIDRYGEQELVELTDDAGRGIVETTKVTRAIDDAAAKVDGYLSGRYTLPLTVVPTALKRIACDLARYYLHDDQVPEIVRTRYEDACRFLEQVGTGRLSLGVDGAGAKPSPSNGAQVQTGGNVFDRADDSFI